MAGSVNKVILVGNLGKDPEARSFQNGGEVVNFSLATSESYKDRDGNRQEKTQWHNVAIFAEGLGKVAKNYLKKGSKVYLEGQLETRKWQGQDGNDRYTTEVVLRQFNSTLVLLDRAEGGGGGGGYGGGRGGGGYDDGGFGGPVSGGRSGGASSANRPAPPAFDDLDDDVPF